MYPKILILLTVIFLLSCNTTQKVPIDQTSFKKPVVSNTPVK